MRAYSRKNGHAVSIIGSATDAARFLGELEELTRDLGDDSTLLVVRVRNALRKRLGLGAPNGGTLS